jgi:hypothetical protein
MVEGRRPAVSAGGCGDGGGVGIGRGRGPFPGRRCNVNFFFLAMDGSGNGGIVENQMLRERCLRSERGSCEGFVVEVSGGERLGASNLVQHGSTDRSSVVHGYYMVSWC